jgi:hypothetical protein
MQTETINIWENLSSLSDEKLKTAYDYLLTQKENIKTVTKGVLLMDVEVSPISTNSDDLDRRIIYTVFVVAPELGNYRKKILAIFEDSKIGRFPVAITCLLDNQVIPNIIEEKFLSVVQVVLAKPVVVNTIENLYRQSQESTKNS